MSALRRQDDEPIHRRRIIRTWLRAQARLADLPYVQTQRDVRHQAGNKELAEANRWG